MSCHAPDVKATPAVQAGSAAAAAEELLLASRDLGGGTWQSELSVPGVHCAACIARVEKAARGLPGVARARVNLSTRRLTVDWTPKEGRPPDLIGTLGAIGYEAYPFGAEAGAKEPELGRLVRALAVAGFSAMNIMLYSVSVWAGTDEGTRHFFHWISAGLALPAIVYSGRVFYASAWSALRRGRTNMDVPISVGVLLAFGLSLYDTIQDARYAYFDAATTLLFFLLVGRTLDHVMRERARSAVAGLARLAPRGATILAGDGTRHYLPVEKVEPGQTVLVAPGDRVPLDGIVKEGRSELDCSLVTGEAAPRRFEPGMEVQAGLLNLTGPLAVTATASAQNSFLAEMIRLMEAAEGGRARHRRLADRAAALYAPVVHTIALATFAVRLAAGGDWHSAATIAIAVLIITCPCALGLAVPIVQVMAARRLYEGGIMVKDGAALERLERADTVVFDKTGTLTAGKPRLTGAEALEPAALAVAAGLAANSRHPFAAAIFAAAQARRLEAPAFDTIRELPGLGLEGAIGASVYRLGREDWATGGNESRGETDSASVLSRDGAAIARFRFRDSLRKGAQTAVSDLQRQGLQLEILSGDRHGAVAAMAEALGIERFEAGLLPSQKVARIEQLRQAGHKVVMVGDGLNDAPALAAAAASNAPAPAADIGRNAADFVFLHESLTAVPEAIAVSRKAGSLVRQNFAFAAAYNALAIPVAVLGYVTPLVAAIAMSASSLVVVANAMRLAGGERRKADVTSPGKAPRPVAEAPPAPG